MIRRANIAAGVVDQLDSDGSEERSKSTKATPTKRSYPSDDHGHNGPHSFLPRHHVTGTGLKPPKYGRMGAFTVSVDLIGQVTSLFCFEILADMFVAFSQKKKELLEKVGE